MNLTLDLSNHILSATNVDSDIQSDLIYKSVVYCLTIPLFVLTVGGNGIILITILFQARLLSSICNYFILSLASADFFVGILVMPYMILFTANRNVWTHGQKVCDFWMSFDFLCSSASFLTLSVMSIERYKMLTTSYVQIKNSSKKRIVAFICLSWMLPFLTWIPVIIGFRAKSGASENSDCTIPAGKYIVLGLSVLLYHIPLVCMVTFYTKLIIHIKNTSILQHEHQEGTINDPMLGYRHRDLSRDLASGSLHRSKHSFQGRMSNSLHNYNKSYTDNNYKSNHREMQNCNSHHDIEPLKKTKLTYTSHAATYKRQGFDQMQHEQMAKVCLRKKDKGHSLKLNKMSKAANQTNEMFEISAYQKARIKRNRKAARMLGFLIAAFSVCWLPYCLSFPISQFLPDLVPSYVTLVIWWMGYMNSAINPFLYVYSNKNIRRSVRAVFCKRIVYSCTSHNQRLVKFRTNSLKANRTIKMQLK